MKRTIIMAFALSAVYMNVQCMDPRPFDIQRDEEMGQDFQERDRSKEACARACCEGTAYLVMGVMGAAMITSTALIVSSLMSQQHNG